MIKYLTPIVLVIMFAQWAKAEEIFKCLHTPNCSNDLEMKLKPSCKNLNLCKVEKDDSCSMSSLTCYRADENPCEAPYRAARVNVVSGGSISLCTVEESFLRKLHVDYCQEANDLDLCQKRLIQKANKYGCNVHYAECSLGFLPNSKPNETFLGPTGQLIPNKVTCDLYSPFCFDPNAGKSDSEKTLRCPSGNHSVHIAKSFIACVPDPKNSQGHPLSGSVK